MTIRDLCTDYVATVEPDASALEAARRMREHHVGDLIVVQANEHGRRPIGVVTDRDLVVGVMAKSVDPSQVRVSELIGEGVATIREDADLSAGIAKMRANGFRRLPVVSSFGELVGVLTLDDAIDALSAQLASLATITRRQPAEERRRRR